jgi:hypothetical protein
MLSKLNENLKEKRSYMLERFNFWKKLASNLNYKKLLY